MNHAKQAIAHEKKLLTWMKAHGLTDLNYKQGSTHKYDVPFVDARGNTYWCESKQNVKSMFGQVALQFKDGKWQPSERSNPGLVRHLNKDIHIKWKNGPSKSYSVAKKTHRPFESDWMPPYAVIAGLKHKGVHYIQINKELFHVTKDVANLGTTSLLASGLQVAWRIRVKYQGHKGKKFGYFALIHRKRRHQDAALEPSVLEALRKKCSLNKT